MANIEDCPGFETFGADVKAARKAKRLSRKTMAEIINVDARYLANIENDGTIPSLPVVIQLIKECGLPVERYFNPEIMREESAQRQRISHKLKLCPEQYLPIIEGAIDGAIQINNPKKKKGNGGCVKASSVFRFARGPQGSLIFLPFLQRNPAFCGQLDVLGAF